MPITIEWDDPYNSIIHCHLTGNWTWADFEESTKQIVEVVRLLPYDVHLMVNTMDGIGFPHGSSPFPHLNNFRRRLPQNVGQIVLVTDKTFVKMVVTVANRFYDKQHGYVVVTSLPEARALLAEVSGLASSRRQLMQRLTHADLSIALAAVDELRALEWLYDGTLEEALLAGVHLSGADLFMANLRMADLRGAQLQGVNFFMANLQQINLVKANLTQAILSEANLSQAMLQEAILNHAQLSPCNLMGANLRGASLWQADLLHADLTGALLHQADLRQSRLSRTLMIGTSLVGAYLNGTKMVFAELTQADLSHADLEGADCRNSNFQMAVLIGARLIGTNLSGANLSGADLREADLQDANLHGVLLDESTILPDGTYWSPYVDICRFSDTGHADYWRKVAPAYASATTARDEDMTIPSRDALMRNASPQSLQRLAAAKKRYLSPED